MSANALEIRGLVKAFSGLRVISDFELCVAPGERRLIIGPNGAGKTTLFNLVAGELRPDQGSIGFFDRELTRLPARMRPRLGLARTFQIITLFPRESLLTNVALALLALSPEKWSLIKDFYRMSGFETTAREVLGRVGLDHLAERPLSEATYGEQRRVEIAMALAQRPKVMLLDEPFAGLSADERAEVKRMLLAIPREVTIVMIEHDMEVALDFADTITLMHFGEVVVEGSRAEVVAHPRTREIYLGQ